MNREDFDTMKSSVHTALDKMTIAPDAKVVLGLIAEIILSVAKASNEKSTPQTSGDEAHPQGSVDKDPPPAPSNDTTPHTPDPRDNELLALVHHAVRRAEPTIEEDLLRESRRANDNLGEVARLVTQAGAAPELIRTVVHEYLVQHVALEQRLVQSLLDIPRGRPAPAKVRVARRVSGAA